MQNKNGKKMYLLMITLIIAVTSIVVWQMEKLILTAQDIQASIFGNYVMDSNPMPPARTWLNDSNPMPPAKTWVYDSNPMPPAKTWLNEYTPFVSRIFK